MQNLKKTLSNDRGSILVLFSVVMIVFIFILAGMVEFGRVLLIREKLQTAADAAALASCTSEVRRMVDIDVITDRGDKKYSHWVGSGNNRHQVNGCKSCGTETENVVGEERELIDNEGWRDYCAERCNCGGYSCSYEINERWIEYTDNKTGSGDTAEEYFQANLEANGLTGEIIKLIRYDDPNHPAYPSVVVYAKTDITSLFPGLFDAIPEKYTTTVCAQASTYYHKDPNDPNSWQEAPEDYTWVDF